MIFNFVIIDKILESIKWYFVLANYSPYKLSAFRKDRIPRLWKCHCKLHTILCFITTVQFLAQKIMYVLCFQKKAHYSKFSWTTGTFQFSYPASIFFGTYITPPMTFIRTLAIGSSLIYFLLLYSLTHQLNLVG